MIFASLHQPELSCGHVPPPSPFGTGFPADGVHRLSEAYITDPFFYALAVPAVLLLGLSKSGFGAGCGSLAVPIMAMAITVPQAAAILMPILLVMDLLGLHAFRREYDVKLLKFLIPWGMVGIGVGFLLFRYMESRWVAGLVGLTTLLFLAQRLVFPTTASSRAAPAWLGALLTATSGFTSFIAHAGGPPINAYVLPMRMAPMVYTATMAFFFFFVNAGKWIPYAILGLLDWRNFMTSLILLPLAPVGVWVGVRVARKIQPVLFYRLVHIGMFCTGLKLLVDAFRG